MFKSFGVYTKVEKSYIHFSIRYDECRQCVGILTFFFSSVCLFIYPFCNYSFLKIKHDIRSQGYVKQKLCNLQLALCNVVSLSCITGLV